MGRGYEPIPDDAEAKPLAEYLREMTMRADVKFAEIAKAVNYGKGTISTAVNGKHLSGLDKYLRHMQGLRVVAAQKGTADQIPDAAEQEDPNAVGRVQKTVGRTVVAACVGAGDRDGKYVTRTPADEDRLTVSSAPAPAPTPPTIGRAGEGRIYGTPGDRTSHRTPKSLATANSKADILTALNELRHTHGFDLSTRKRRTGLIGPEMTGEMLTEILDGRVRLSRNRVTQVAAACDDPSPAWGDAWDRVEFAEHPDLDTYGAGHAGDHRSAETVSEARPPWDVPRKVTGIASVVTPPELATATTGTLRSPFSIRRRRHGRDVA